MGELTDQETFARLNKKLTLKKLVFDFGETAYYFKIILNKFQAIVLNNARTEIVCHK